MTRRYLSGGLALACMTVLSGCFGQVETPEQCIERFERMLADAPVHRDTRFQPIFTYDVTHMKDALETFAGKGDELTGVRMTMAHGAIGPALDAFYRAEVPEKGAAFGSENLSLYRMKGAPGLPAETVIAGCRATPAEARLIHIQFAPLRAEP